MTLNNYCQINNPVVRPWGIASLKYMSLFEQYTSLAQKIFIFLFLILSLTGCTTLPGGAKVTNYEENKIQNIPGLLDDRKGDVHVFYIHGMGKTESDFAKPLLDQANRLFSLPTSPFPKELPPCKESGSCWIIQLPNPLNLRGEALDCGNQEKCTINTFGELRRFEFKESNRSVIFYAYFWDKAAAMLQEKYSYTDLDIKERDAWFNTFLKNSVVNYGFSDATLYTGTFGYVMRQGLESALCVMLSDVLDIQVDRSIACNLSKFSLSHGTDSEIFQTKSERLNLSFVAKSLGSRYLFDTLLPLDQVNLLQRKFNDDRFEETIAVLDSDVQNAIATINTKRTIIGHTNGVFLLANQLPLLGLSNITAYTKEEQEKRDYIYCRFVLQQQSELNCRTPLFINTPINQSFFDFAQTVKQYNNAENNKLNIIAFRDPEDLLGYKAGEHLTDNAKNNLNIIEISHRNTPVIAFFFALPNFAHATEDQRESAADIIWCGATVQEGGLIHEKSCGISQQKFIK